MTNAKTKNIIDMAIGFTAMARIFKPKSSGRIHRKLEELLGRLDKEDYEEIHSSFCTWFMNAIETNLGRRTSYGQAAKVLDVTLKVIVSYCQLPEPSIAAKIIPRLHCAIDTPILFHLKRNYSMGKGIFTLSQIDKNNYKELQSFVNQEAKKAGLSAVEYDDILWRSLNRERKRTGNQTAN